jgi:hypothetical protein
MTSAYETRGRAYYHANREKFLARSARWFAEHKEERAAYNAAHREEKKAYNRAYLLARHGLTPETFDALLVAQSNGCAICGGQPGQKGWVIDHSHDTGMVRGILCSPCNILLGMARDDTEVLASASAYLRKAR